MKNEQTAFGDRLSAALAAKGLEASPSELERLLARHGGTPVTPQAISGWLSGKHMPKQANMRALAAMLGMEPHVLQFGGKATQAVRETHKAWPGDLSGPDRLAFEEFRSLPAAQRKLVRELIAVLATAASRQSGS
jgi:transcriptional regulator with XRE-family HTH domain